MSSSLIATALAVLGIFLVCLLFREQLFKAYLAAIRKWNLGKSAEDSVFTYPLF